MLATQMTSDLIRQREVDEYGGDSSISPQGEGFANRGIVWEVPSQRA